MEQQPPTIFNQTNSFQQQFLSMDIDMADVRMKRPKQIKKLLNYTKSDGDEHDEWKSNDTVKDMTCIKRGPNKVLGHKSSIVERQTNGAIMITPNYRQLPTEIISNDCRSTHSPKRRLSMQSHQLAVLYDGQTLVCTKHLTSTRPNINTEPIFQCFVISQSNTQRHQQQRQTATYQVTQVVPSSLDRLSSYVINTWSRPYLKQLENNAHITQESLQHIPYHCRQLTSLSLYSGTYSTRLLWRL